MIAAVVVMVVVVAVLTVGAWWGAAPRRWRLPLLLTALALAPATVAALTWKSRRETFQEEQLTRPSLFAIDGGANSVCFSQDGTHVFVGGTGKLSVYKIKDGVLNFVLSRTLKDKGLDIMRLVLSRNGKYLAAMAMEVVVVYDVARLIGGRQALVVSRKSWRTPYPSFHKGPTVDLRSAVPAVFTADDTHLILADSKLGYVLGLEMPKLKLKFMLAPPPPEHSISMLALNPFDADEVLVGMTNKAVDQLQGTASCQPGTVFTAKLSQHITKTGQSSFSSFQTSCMPVAACGLGEYTYIASALDRKIGAYAVGSGKADMEVDHGGMPLCMVAASNALLVASVDNVSPSGMSDLGGWLSVVDPKTLERTSAWVVGSTVRDLAVSGDLAIVASGSGIACASLSGQVTYQVPGAKEYAPVALDGGGVRYMTSDAAEATEVPEVATAAPNPT